MVASPADRIRVLRVIARLGSERLVRLPALGRGLGGTRDGSGRGRDAREHGAPVLSVTALQVSAC